MLRSAGRKLIEFGENLEMVDDMGVFYKDLRTKTISSIVVCCLIYTEVLTARGINAKSHLLRTCNISLA